MGDVLFPKDKTSTNTQQQSNKDKKSVKCWNCNAQGHVAKDCPKKKQSLSAVESQEQPPSSSGATGETTLSGSFLDAWEEEAELNSFESKIAGVLVTGIDSGAARSVVPGEIHGYCVERVSETGRVYTSGETADPGNSGRTGARLEHASRASQEESHERVRHVCGRTCVVFDFDSNKRHLGHAENKLTGERTHPCIGARSQNHLERANRGHTDKRCKSRMSRSCVLSRGRYFGREPNRGPRGFWTCSRHRNARRSWPCVRARRHPSPSYARRGK